MRMVHTTVAGNKALSRGEMSNWYSSRTLGGGIYATTGIVTLVNSLLSSNVTCFTDRYWRTVVLFTNPPNGNCYGSLTDGGYNISSDGSFLFSANGSRINTDPLLGPLGNYGGPTPVLPLLEGSPAVDAADQSSCPPTDQRGVPRPAGAGCDIGAFEGYLRLAPILTAEFTPIRTVTGEVAMLRFTLLNPNQDPLTQGERI